MTRRLALALALLAACARGGEEGGGDPKPEPLPAAEIERGRTACTELAERLCRCAAGKPDLATGCEEARALPEALRMNVDAAASSGLSRSVALRLQYEARRTMAQCFERLNQLPALGCR